MAQTLIFSYANAVNYTQAEEDALAATLTGKPYGWTIIFNTT